MKSGEKSTQKIKKRSGVINGRLTLRQETKREKTGDKLTVKPMRSKSTGQKSGTIDI